MITKVYGSPGTGKTAWLLQKLHEETKSTPVDNIAFITWSTSACEEVLTRLGFKNRKNYFRTLHGAMLSVIRNKENGEMREKIDKTYTKKDFVIGWQIEFCAKNRIPFNPHVVWSEAIGNVAFNLATYAFSQYPKLGDREKCLRIVERENQRAYKIVLMWEAFKKEKGIIDFNDYMIYAYEKELTIPCDVLFLDEAQDLSLLEFEIIQKTIDQCKRVFIAGDDDQAIYGFKGANAKYFLELKADEEIVLPKTHRLPRNILKLSQRLIDKVVLRKPKDVKTDKEGGTIKMFGFWRIQDIAKFAVDLAKANENSTVFLLFRTNRMVEEAEKTILENFPYPFKKLKGESIWNKFLTLWNAVAKTRKRLPLNKKEMKEILELVPYFTVDEKELILKTIEEKGSPPIAYYQVNKYLDYYIEKSALSERKKNALKRACEPFDHENINLYIDTIHASKGREADIVILCDGVPNVYKCLEDRESMEDEIRLFYVGTTRAKKALYIMKITGFDSFLDNFGLF